MYSFDQVKDLQSSKKIQYYMKLILFYRLLILFIILIIFNFKKRISRVPNINHRIDQFLQEFIIITIKNGHFIIIKDTDVE